MKAFRWLCAALSLLALVLLAACGLAQTRVGQVWLARAIGQAVSSPDFSVTIDGLGGIVPFRPTVDRIEIADRDGPYLVLHDFGLDISAADLLAGRLHIRSLSFAEIDMARLSTAPSTTPPTEYLKVPHQPIGFALDRVLIGQLVLAPAVLGERLVATVDGSAQLPDGLQKAVEAHLRVGIPELSPLAALLRTNFAGSASLTASVTGTESRPILSLNLTGSGIRSDFSGTEHVEAEVSATPTGALDKPDARIEFAAHGRIKGLALAGVAVPRELGRDIDWSLAGNTDRDGSTVDLTRVSVDGLGIELTGAGQITEPGRGIKGQLRLAVADLRPFSGFVGHPIVGSLELSAESARESAGGFNATLQGTANGVRTGIAAGDALLGDSVTLTGLLRLEPAGALILDQLAIAGAAVNLSGDAKFDPLSNQLAAALALEVPRLQPLGPALGTDMAGALTADINAEGTLDHLRLRSEIEGSDIAASGARIDRLRVTGEVPDLSEPKATLDGAYRAHGLDGRLALAAELENDSELVLRNFRVTAADSAVQGSLRIALATGLASGSITGRAPDLERLSRLAGTPLGGSLEFSAGLDARGGQQLNLSLTGARLAAGAGSSRIAIGRLGLTARFADVLRVPSGTGRLSLTSASVGGAEIGAANLAIDAPRPGRFAFQADAKGKPLSVAFAGDGGVKPGRIDLRLTRLAGSLGSDRLFLEQPLTLSRRGADLAFSGLTADFGTGRITGGGAVRGESLSLALNIANLPIASAAQLMGYPRARGTLTIATTLSGTLHAPRGHISVNARGLSVAASRHSHLPALGLGVDGDWNGRSIDLKGQVTGLKGDTISLAGSVPLLLIPSPLGISVPAGGQLSFQLQGAGRLENLADLLPLGEDRVSGHFSADIAVGGTVASPSANGRLKLSDARYENFATGAVLTNMQADVVGDRDLFSLTSLSAGDSANGSLRGQGNIVLKGPSGPTATVSATLTNFRIAARDEAVVTASGTVAITGSLTAPKVSAPLTIDRADINLPSSLPPNVVVLKVVRINNDTGKQPPPAAPAAEPPALPATLDIKIDMPANVFVRGHGLDSEWRGQLAITGTSAAPAINGSLEQIRGSVDFLGKTFTLTRGRITFDGSDKLDPVLDIIAEASTTDVTAQVNIGGFASAPTVTLTSTPVVPQDEILARVLFGKSVTQMSAGEGLQLAAAAASLAGGGPGVLDRLRGGLGLDWFRLGSSATGPTTGTLNPGGLSNSATSGTALSAGKYIAPGVSVGVSQGISPPTSKVTVEIQVLPHVTVGGEAGQSGSTGIGLNYNYDY